MTDDQQRPEWVPPGFQPAPAAPPAGPPTYGPPTYGPPTYGPPAYGPPPQHSTPYPYPQSFQPVHKPGIVALRPLGLGDLYDGAFTAIRRNPRPMIGLAALVATSALLIPALVTVVLAATGDLAFDLEETGAMDAVTIAGSLLTALAGILLSGMIVHVVVEATLGRKATIEATWRAVRGRTLRLIGLALLSLLAAGLLVGVPILVGVLSLDLSVPLGVVLLVVGVPAGLCSTVYLWTRLVLLAAPAMVIERLGVFAALRRAWALSKGQFWRMFGIALLTQVVVGIVSQILAVPMAVLAVGGLLLIEDPTTAALVYVFANYVSLILGQALSTPFAAAVQALQYVDQRIRKEAYDVELIARAQPAPVA